MPLDAISEPELDSERAVTPHDFDWGHDLPDLVATRRRFLADSKLAGNKQSHGTFENLSLTDCGISSSKRRESHSCSLGVWCEARNCNPIRCSLAQQTVDSSVN